MPEKVWAPRGAGLAWLHANVSHDGEECLRWPFGKREHRAKTVFNGKETLAYRAMCELAHGPSPARKPMALHSCGQGHLNCINPKHLYWGDRLDNAKDAKRHGVYTVGSARHLSKLTEDQVLGIRGLYSAGVTQRSLAAQFHVSKGLISFIVNRKIWKHI